MTLFVEFRGRPVVAFSVISAALEIFYSRCAIGTFIFSRDDSASALKCDSQNDSRRFLTKRNLSLSPFEGPHTWEEENFTCFYRTRLCVLGGEPCRRTMMDCAFPIFLFFSFTDYVLFSIVDVVAAV